MPTTRVLSIVLAALAFIGAGCGGGGQSGSQPAQQTGGGGGDNELSASDAADVLGARRTIDDQCGGNRANKPEGQSLPAAVQTLVTVTQLYPDKVYETGSEDRAEQMRTVAEQVGQQLRQCGIDDQASRLGRAAAS